MIDSIGKYTTTYQYSPPSCQHDQYITSGIWGKNINMETLKAYLNRIRFPSVSSSTSVAAKGTKKEKLCRKGSLQHHGSSKALKKNKYQNHDPLSSRDSNGFTSIHGINNIDFIDNEYEIPQCTMVSTLKLALQNSVGKKSPPPIKPPRRDKILVIDLDVKKGGELGISIDAVDLFSVENYFYGESPTRKRIYSDRGIDSMNGYADIVEVLRIVNIKEGGIVHKDGRIHVYDEILELNGQSLQKETVGNARLLLANAVKTGRLTMTLRRRKKRPAPPLPTTTTPQEMHFSESRTASSEMSSQMMTTSSHMSHMHSSYSSHMTHKQSNIGHVTSHIHSSQSTSNHTSHMISQYGNNISQTMSQVSNHASHTNIGLMNGSYHQNASINQVKVEEDHLYEPVEITNGVYRQKKLSQSLNSFLNVESENNNNNDGSSCTLNSLMYNSEYSSNDDVFADASSNRQCDNDPPYTVTVIKAVTDKKKPSYVNLDIDKQRTLSASAIEDDLQWNSVPIDFPKEDDSYITTAEIARRKHDRGLKQMNLNKTLNSDSSIHKSDPDIVNNQRKHFRKNRKSPRYTANRDCSDLSSSTGSSSSAKIANQRKKRVVTKMHLIKDETGLGIHIAGGKGSRKGDLGIFVAEVTTGGAADRDGRLKRGDELLMINGKSLIGLTHQEAVEVMRQAPKLVQIVVASKIKRSGTLPSMSSGSQSIEDCKPATRSADMTQQIPDLTAETPHGTVMKWEELFEEIFADESLVGSVVSKIEDLKFSRPSDQSEDNLTESAIREQTLKAKTYDPPQTITINKGARGKGLGFTIVGGSDSEKGNLGIYVRRILPRGLIAEDGNMKEGDEILEVNGFKVTGLTHKEALAKFRRLQRGPVSFTFRRRVRSRSNSPFNTGGRVISGGEFSSDGSPVSTPGHSPYSSCTNLANIEDEFAGFYDDVEGKSQCNKLDFSDFLTNTNVIFSMDSDTDKADSTDHLDSKNRTDHLDSKNSTHHLDSKNSTHSKNDIHIRPHTVKERVKRLPVDIVKDEDQRPNSVLNPTVKCQILLQKEQGIGLGILLMRRDHNGTSHIYIQDVKSGSPADKDGRLKKEDMILEVNGRSLQNLSLLDAHQIFRGLQPGNVTLVIKRKQKHKEGID
ncbi:multiple PDZ domain protein-like isoform X3 [Mytilus californianus]|uniref:multiple PDZ domain protein-like isoform X3 n=1 Tax=Mytilus californianus TaxID=6549 RepID=UPI002245B8CF|nr:multiple PDZ domain protein-like isoform X3 [Mytilus californianus]